MTNHEEMMQLAEELGDCFPGDLGTYRKAEQENFAASARRLADLVLTTPVPVALPLAERERATVIHALRGLQRYTDDVPRCETCDHFDKGFTPLGWLEIDVLCERLAVPLPALAPAPTVTLPRALYQLLCDVAADTRDNMECNCGDPCDGSCTHGMAQRALDAAVAHSALFTWPTTSPAPAPCTRSTFSRPCRLAAGHPGACELMSREQLAAVAAQSLTAQTEDRWAGQSAAFQAEKPWCGWVTAFGADSECDTTCFGLERMEGINILLTTADGRSRPVTIDTYRATSTVDEATGGILLRELDPKDYEPLERGVLEFVAYTDIREIVVY